MGVSFPNKSPKAWNTCKLGSVTIPGIVSVGVKPGQDVEVKKAKGKVGASTSLQGPKPAKITIKTKLLRQSQLDDWAKAVKILLPAKDSGQSLAFEHPKATLYSIAAVTVEDIDDPPNDEKGDIIEITISCVEFKPPTKKKATKTEKTLDARNNSLTSNKAARDVTVSKPRNDPKNKAPRKK